MGRSLSTPGKTVCVRLDYSTQEAASNVTPLNEAIQTTAIKHIHKQTARILFQADTRLISRQLRFGDTVPLPIVVGP